MKYNSSIRPLYTDLLIIMLVLVAGMWQIVFAKSMMKWDIMDINLPWRYFISETLRDGELPLWNPYITAGFPQCADPMTWYPVSWIISFLFGYNVLALQYEFLLHILWGAIGVYMLGDFFGFQRTSRLILSIAFMFSGLFISNAQHLGWIVSCSWFPMIIYLYLNFCRHHSFRFGLLFILCLNCMLTGGYPAFFIITVYILLCIFIFYGYKALVNKSSIIRFICYNLILSVGFISLSAVVLTSSFELSHFLYRTQKFTIDFAQSFPLPVKGLLSFLFPYATTGNVNFHGADFSMVNCYIGIIPVVFFLYSILMRNKQAVFFSLIGFLFLSAAMSHLFPTRRLLYYLPFMNIFRFAALFRFFAYSFFILASGIGLHNYFSGKTNDKKLIYIISTLLSATFILLLLNYFHIEKWKFRYLLSFNFPAFDHAASIAERIQFQAILVFLQLVLLLIVCCKLTVRKQAFVLVGILILDMVVSTQLNLNHTIVSNTSPFPAQKAINKISPGFPIPDITVPLSENTEKSTPGIPNLWRNMNVFYKRPSAEGYTPYYLKSRVKAENEDCYYSIVKNPLVFLVDTFHEGIINPEIKDPFPNKKITITKFSPNSLEARVFTNKRQLLVLLQSVYPGWNCYVNGEKSQLLIVNYAFQCVWLNKGENQIKLIFRPCNTIIGFYITIISLLVVISISVYLTFFNRKSPN
jgi:hypothetical protein